MLITIFFKNIIITCVLPYLSLFYLAFTSLCICDDACTGIYYSWKTFLVCPGGCMLRFCFCFRAGCSMWCHGWLPCLVLSSAAGSLTTCCPKVSIINTVLCKSLTIENKITQLLIPGNFFCISSLNYWAFAAMQMLSHVSLCFTISCWLYLQDGV